MSSPPWQRKTKQLYKGPKIREMAKQKGCSLASSKDKNYCRYCVCVLLIQERTSGCGWMWSGHFWVTGAAQIADWDACLKCQSLTWKWEELYVTSSHPSWSKMTLGDMAWNNLPVQAVTSLAWSPPAVKPTRRGKMFCWLRTCLWSH